MRTDVWRFALGIWAEHLGRGLALAPFGTWIRRFSPACKPMNGSPAGRLTNESHNGYIDIL